MAGTWDDAIADADDVLSGPSAPLARFLPHLARALVALRRTGEPGPDLNAAWDLARSYGERLRMFHAAAAIVERAWLTGGPDERLAEVRTLLDEPPRVGLEWARGELVAWWRRFEPEANVSPEGLAEPYRREVEGDLAGAVACWKRIGAPYEEALTGVATREPDAVRAGLDLLDRLGADAVAGKVRQSLRSDGMLVVPARPRAPTRAHPAGLTARQEEVLRHMSDGLTNAELADALYISSKTVDHHVSAILAKLGAASRREAVRTARALGLFN